MSIITTTQKLSALGAGAPIQVLPPAQAGFFSGGYLEPGILVQLSSGASLTYNIEVSGDDALVQNYVAANGLWLPVTNMSALTASAVNTLGAVVRAIRANITIYSSGTLTFQFCQLANFGA
jgi:hypothetical protein